MPNTDDMRCPVPVVLSIHSSACTHFSMLPGVCLLSQSAPIASSRCACVSTYSNHDSRGVFHEYTVYSAQQLKVCRSRQLDTWPARLSCRTVSFRFRAGGVRVVRARWPGACRGSMLPAPLYVLGGRSVALASHVLMTRRAVAGHKRRGALPLGKRACPIAGSATEPSRRLLGGPPWSGAPCSLGAPGSLVSPL